MGWIIIMIDVGAAYEHMECYEAIQLNRSKLSSLGHVANEI